MFGKKSATALLAALAIAAMPLVGHAGDAAGNPCESQHSQPGDQGKNDLCAAGMAACVAVGVHVRIEPTTGLPGGATVQLSRSDASAASWADPRYGWAYGQGHGDAAQARADVSPTLGAGAVESECDALSQPQYNYAHGEADVTKGSLSLAGYGLPVFLSWDVLHEIGTSVNGAGSNTANIAALSGSVFGIPLPAVALSAPPNTAIPLGPLGTLYLNEQFVGMSPFFCPVYSGDALRLVVTNPTTGATVATIIISWVSVSTCPPMFGDPISFDGTISTEV